MEKEVELQEQEVEDVTASQDEIGNNYNLPYIQSVSKESEDKTKFELKNVTLETGKYNIQKTFFIHILSSYVYNRKTRLKSHIHKKKGNRYGIGF